MREVVLLDPVVRREDKFVRPGIVEKSREKNGGKQRRTRAVTQFPAPSSFGGNFVTTVLILNRPVPHNHSRLLYFVESVY